MIASRVTCRGRMSLPCRFPMIHRIGRNRELHLRHLQYSRSMFTFCSSPRMPTPSRFSACCAGQSRPSIIAVRLRYQADGAGTFEDSQDGQAAISHLRVFSAGNRYEVGNLCGPLLRLPKKAIVDAKFWCEGHRLHLCGRGQPARWMRNSHPWFSMRNGGVKRREGSKFMWLYSNY